MFGKKNLRTISKKFPEAFETSKMPRVSPDCPERSKFFSVKQQIFISTKNILKSWPEKGILVCKIMRKIITFGEVRAEKSGQI